MVKDGAKLTGVVERDGSAWNPEGINPKELKEYIVKTGGIVGFPGAEVRLNDSVMYEACDVLIPAAMEKSIHKDNVMKIQAHWIVEGSNGGTTVRADTYLTEKNTLIVPDILANAAGVTCSYFEWLKNLDHRRPGRITKKVKFLFYWKLKILVGREIQKKAHERTPRGLRQA
jgi:glutamate dehydrogenase (NAD(P)+)